MNTKIFIKELKRGLLKLMPAYSGERRQLRRTDGEAMMHRAVRRAVKRVPYYKKYADVVGKEDFSLQDFPIIRKPDVLNHSRELVSRRAFKPLLHRKETGGSTGMSLELFVSPGTVMRNAAVVDGLFAMVAPKCRTAVLRGNVPAGGAVCQAIGNGDILLSSYLLSAENLDEYLSALRLNDINCLHVYPSAVSVLARLVYQRYGSSLHLPELRGIIASSEVFSADDKAIVAKAFPGVKVIDYYSHNEQACAAYSVDGEPYRFIPSFGYVEFIPTGDTVNGGHRVAEIVATSVMNRTMPFIRYGTDDYVELDDDGNVLSIIGRTSDQVIDRNGERVPCMVNTRDVSFANVLNFQYYQPAEGKLIMRVVVNDRYTESDRQNLLEDMNNSFAGRLDCDVVVVKDVDRTRIGKQIRLVSDLNQKKNS